MANVHIAGGSWKKSLCVPATPPRSAFDLIREIGRVLAVYIGGQILIAAIVTVLYMIGFALVRVPLWFLVALICGALNLIPRIGSIFALGVAVLAVLLGRPGALHAVETLAVWVAVQSLEGFVITPRILGRPLGLRPLVVFIALLLGSFFFGPLGLFLAVPVLAVAKLVWKFVFERDSIETAGRK